MEYKNNMIFFLHVRMCWCCAFCNVIGNTKISNEMYLSTKFSKFSLILIPYTSLFLVHKRLWSCYYHDFEIIWQKKL
jgi:hypothetical protein